MGWNRKTREDLVVRSLDRGPHCIWPSTRVGVLSYPMRECGATVHTDHVREMNRAELFVDDDNDCSSSIEECTPSHADEVMYTPSFPTASIFLG